MEGKNDHEEKKEGKKKKKSGLSDLRSKLNKSITSVRKMKSSAPENFTLSEPVNFRQTAHIGFDAETGEFKGMPKEWEVLLLTSGLRKDEYAQNPQMLLKVLEYQQEYLTLQSPPSPPPPSSSMRTILDDEENNENNNNINNGYYKTILEVQKKKKLPEPPPPPPISDNYDDEEDSDCDLSFEEKSLPPLPPNVEDDDFLEPPSLPPPSPPREVRKNSNSNNNSNSSSPSNTPTMNRKQSFNLSNLATISSSAFASGASLAKSSKKLDLELLKQHKELMLSSQKDDEEDDNNLDSLQKRGRGDTDSISMMKSLLSPKDIPHDHEAVNRVTRSNSDRGCLEINTTEKIISKKDKLSNVAVSNSLELNTSNKNNNHSNNDDDLENEDHIRAIATISTSPPRDYLHDEEFENNINIHNSSGGNNTATTTTTTSNHVARNNTKNVNTTPDSETVFQTKLQLLHQYHQQQLHQQKVLLQKQQQQLYQQQQKQQFALQTQLFNQPTLVQQHKQQLLSQQHKQQQLLLSQKQKKYLQKILYDQQQQVARFYEKSGKVAPVPTLTNPNTSTSTSPRGGGGKSPRGLNSSISPRSATSEVVTNEPRPSSPPPQPSTSQPQTQPQSQPQSQPHYHQPPNDAMDISSSSSSSSANHHHHQQPAINAQYQNNNNNINYYQPPVNNAPINGNYNNNNNNNNVQHHVHDRLPIVKMKSPPIPPEVYRILDPLVSKEDPQQLYYEQFTIGQGSSGTVSVAIDRRNNNKVAIKKMILSHGVNQIDTLESEIKIMKNSRHKNIVSYIDSYLVGNSLWCVMEYMDGGDLTEIIRCCRTTYTETQVAAILKEVLEGLRYLHTLPVPIIHRDIKSDNVLLGLDGRVKLTDFGFGAQLTKEKNKRNSVIGTTYWMAPEVITSRDYDTKVDVWSVGILAQEIVEGEPPYMEESSVKALYLIASQGRAPFKDPGRLSPAFKNFVKQCTIMDPFKRPTSTQLLKHPFLATACPPEGLIPLVKITQEALEAEVQEY